MYHHLHLLKPVWPRRRVRRCVSLRNFFQGTLSRAYLDIGHDNGDLRYRSWLRGCVMSELMQSYLNGSFGQLTNAEWGWDVAWRRFLCVIIGITAAWIFCYCESRSIPAHSQCHLSLRGSELSGTHMHTSSRRRV
jgi:hypothetical protein